jgi:hypothetical protein
MIHQQFWGSKQEVS